MRALAAVLFSGLSLILAGTAEAGFGRGSLLGSYGCLANSIAGVDAASNQITGLSELMQLNLSATSSITGTITVNSVGERCIVAVSPGSVFSVNPRGTGTMLLALAASGMDLDSDQDCGRVAQRDRRAL